MKKYILILTVSLLSCGRTSDKPSEKKFIVTILNGDTVYKTKDTYLCNANNEYKFECYDSIDTNTLKSLWNYAAVPIINKDKNDFISKIHFPLMGDWTRMMHLKVDELNASKKDFSDIYDKFFNNEFMDSLSKRNYKEIYFCSYNDTLEFRFGVHKKYKDYPMFGGADVDLCFRLINDSIKLWRIYGAGGDFY